MSSVENTLADAPSLGVLIIEGVPGACYRLMYRLGSEVGKAYRFKSLAVHDRHGTKSCIAEGTLAALGGDTQASGCPLIWTAGDVDIAFFIAGWSDASLQLEEWLKLVDSEPWLNQAEKDRLRQFYAIYLREKAR